MPEITLFGAERARLCMGSHIYWSGKMVGSYRGTHLPGLRSFNETPRPPGQCWERNGAPT